MRYYNSVTLEGTVAPGSIRSEIKGQGTTTLSFCLCTREHWYRNSDKACTHTEYHPVMLRDNSSWQMYTRYGNLIVPRAKLFIVGKLRHKSLTIGTLRASVTQIDCSFVRKAADNDEDLSPRRRYGRREWAEIPTAAEEQAELTDDEAVPAPAPQIIAGADISCHADSTDEAGEGEEWYDIVDDFDRALLADGPYKPKAPPPPKKYRVPWWGLTEEELMCFTRRSINPYEEVPDNEPGYFAPPGKVPPQHAA